MNEREIGKRVEQAALDIHRELGPGLLERVYEVTLCEELRRQGLAVTRNVPLAIRYKGIIFDEGFQADLVVNDSVIVELECLDQLTTTHKKRLLTYLRLADKRLGLLLNFGERFMHEGILRAVNAPT
ncbi:MAG: GxxExxY protein [Pseudomonadota bacterium]